MMSKLAAHVNALNVPVFFWKSSITTSMWQTEREGWRMSAIVSASTLNLHPLRLWGSRTCVRGRFCGLRLENRMLRVSCRRSNDLQLWVIKWAPAWQCGCVRAASRHVRHVEWVRSHGEPGHHSVVTYTESTTYVGTQYRGEKLWHTFSYQCRTSHIISTTSTSFSSEQRSLHVVHNWKRSPDHQIQANPAVMVTHKVTYMTHSFPECLILKGLLSLMHLKTAQD